MNCELCMGGTVAKSVNSIFYCRVTDLQAENFQSIYNSFLKTKCIVNHYPWKVIHADEYNIQLFEVWLISSNWIGRKYSNIMRFLTRYFGFYLHVMVIEKIAHGLLVFHLFTWLYIIYILSKTMDKEKS